MIRLARRPSGFSSEVNDGAAVAADGDGLKVEGVEVADRRRADVVDFDRSVGAHDPQGPAAGCVRSLARGTEDDRSVVRDATTLVETGTLVPCGINARPRQLGGDDVVHVDLAASRATGAVDVCPVDRERDVPAAGRERRPTDEQDG